MARPESTDCGDDHWTCGTVPAATITSFPKSCEPKRLLLHTPQRAPLWCDGTLGYGDWRRLHEERSAEQLDKNLKREHLMSLLKKSTRQHFPDLFTKTYFVPAILFNRLEQSESFHGSDVIKILLPVERMSDVRADETRQRVHNCLSSMFFGKSEDVMVVCFALPFDHYLNCGGKANAPTEKNRHARLHNECGSGNERQSGKHSARGSPPYSCRARIRIQKCHHHHSNNIQVDVSPSTNAIPSLPGLSDSDLSSFPRPRDLPAPLQRGEFDVLIIHRNCGYFVIEVKAVGDVFLMSSDSLSTQLNIVSKKVGMSLKQLNKQVQVLRYLVKDVHANVPITKVLILPNLTRQMLRAALTKDPALKQAFHQTFDAETLDDALRKCVFSEQLPPIGHAVSANDDVIKKLLRDWWLPLKESITFSGLNDDQYESVVARFCGPATKQYASTPRSPRVEVSTLSQAVLETSRCFTAPVLTERQEKMLGESSPRVFLSGPPGTGKTMMLMLKAKEWLRQGHAVMIISLWTSSHAVSCYIFEQVQQDVTTQEAGRLFHVLNRKPLFEDVMTKLKTFKQSSQTETPIQENPSLDNGLGDYEPSGDNSDYESDDYTMEDTTDADSANQNGESSNSKSEGRDFTDQHSETQESYIRPHARAEESTDHHGKLHVVVDEAPWFLDKLMLVLDTVLGKDGFVLWAASSYPCPQPSRFTCCEMTQNLRCPPAVVREMTKTLAHRSIKRVEYSSQDAGVLSGMPYPTDGPMVKRIQHDFQGAVDVWDCEDCGEAVADFLIHDLKMGKSVTETPTACTAAEKTLHFSDVLISGYLPRMCDVINSTRKAKVSGREDESPFRKLHPLPGLLRGLERKRIDFDVMEKDDVKSYQKLAFPRTTDRVQVAEPDMVKGLERKVVVVLGAEDFAAAVPRYVDPLFDVMGCCTSQLVIVGDAESSLAEKLQRVAGL